MSHKSWTQYQNMKNIDINKLKKILDWKKINKAYKTCFPSKRGGAAKKTDISLGLLIQSIYIENQTGPCRGFSTQTPRKYTF